MTFDANKMSYRYCFDDTVTDIVSVPPEKIEAVIGQWADFITTDFDTGVVSVPDQKGDWVPIGHISSLGLFPKWVTDLVGPGEEE